MTILQFIALSELGIHHSEWPATITVEPINDPIYYRLFIINRLSDHPLLFKDSKDKSKNSVESITWGQIDAIMIEYNDQEIANKEKREELLRSIRNGMPLNKAIYLPPPAKIKMRKDR